MSNRIRIKALPFAVAVLLAAPPVFAQNTSSAINGRVLGPKGQPIVGATVTIVHVPSGTTRVVGTNAKGIYNAQGLRVGGPFDVLVSKHGFKATENDHVYLKLAQTSEVDFTLGVQAKELANVVVMANSLSSIFQPDNKGLSTTITRSAISSLPATGRSLQDYVRLDPLVNITNPARGEISALGQNSRYNNITIDAVPTNDPFGLEAGGMPSLGQPISIDTISEINVSTNNYDVTNARNTGAQINAVTKSGTNDFHGSLYDVYLPKGWVGDGKDNQPFTGFNRKTTDGFTLGGPIVKNKLFFFVGYEKSKTSAPAPNIGIIGSGMANIVNITPTELSQISSIAQGYGLPTGSAVAGALNTDEKRYLAKIDWNITDNHRLSFRYDRVTSNLAVFPGFSTRYSGSVGLQSNNYSQLRDFKNVVVNLYDDWSENFSTETSVSYGKYSRLPKLNASAPLVTVHTNGRFDPAVILGTNTYYQGNSLSTKTWTGFWAGTLFLGNHTIKFGADFTRNSYHNLFLPYYFGVYSFNTIADFQSGNYAYYQLRQPSSGRLSGASAIWSYNNYGLFAQDDWQVNDQLSLQYGLRWDIPKVDQKPQLNSGFQQAFGMANNHTIDGNSVLQPRVSFNYSFNTKRPMQLKGGAGLFMGATPGVWQSNPFTNNGLTVTTYKAYSPSQGGAFSADPYNQPTPPTSPPAQTVDLLNNNFRQPTVFKASLGFDSALPWWGMVASANVSYLQDKDAIYYQNLNLGTPSAYGPDGRPIYYRLNSNGSVCTSRSCELGNANPAYGSIMLLSNTARGSATYFTLALSRPANNGFAWSASWTHGRSSSVNNGTSSIAYSNWKYSPSVNPNADIAYTANYNVRDRFSAWVSWSHRFIGDYRTTVGAFLNVASGSPYSWIFGNDANGDGRSNNDLVYVPSAPGAVEFTSNTSAQLQQQFFNYIKTQAGLRQYAGRDVPRNSAHLPWTHELDLRLTQEVPGLFKGNKGEVVIDVYNFLNMLNHNWGQYPSAGFPAARSIANFAGIDTANGKYIYDLSRYTDSNGNYAPQSYSTLDSQTRPLSRWSVQVTLRYTF